MFLLVDFVDIFFAICFSLKPIKIKDKNEFSNSYWEGDKDEIGSGNCFLCKFFFLFVFVLIILLSSENQDKFFSIIDSIFKSNVNYLNEIS